jgi:hypothetical protein
MKHNKLKNTGIIFEILCKKIMHETLNPTNPQTALKIVKKHFNVNSQLLSELRLYQQLNQSSVSVNADELINLVIKNRINIDENKLNVEKYNLNKIIKKHYNLTEFYNSRITNYKVLASIYNLFENKTAKNPTSYLQNKQIISENLTGKSVKELDEIEQIIAQEEPDIRKLSFKIIVEKFNEKYRTLNTKQQQLLSKYINEDETDTKFKDYVITECKFIEKKLNIKKSKLTNPIQQIKLNEVINLLNNIVISDKIKEDHLSAMLTYYELINEIK